MPLPHEVHEYDATTKTAARHLMRYQPSVDNKANGADDYQSMMLVEAWRAHQKFGADPRGEERRKYCCKAVWNAKASFARKRQAAQRLEGSPVLLSTVTDRELPVTDNLEAAHHARETLEFLKAQFSERDWSILERLGLNDGKWQEAYDQAVDGITMDAFFLRVRRLRERAQALLRGEG